MSRGKAPISFDKEAFRERYYHCEGCDTWQRKPRVKINPICPKCGLHTVLYSDTEKMQFRGEPPHRKNFSIQRWERIRAWLETNGPAAPEDIARALELYEEGHSLRTYRRQVYRMKKAGKLIVVTEGLNRSELLQVAEE